MSKVPQCQEIWQDNELPIRYYIVAVLGSYAFYVIQGYGEYGVGKCHRFELHKVAHYVGTSRIAPDDLFERINDD